MIQARELVENAAAGRELPPAPYDVLDPPLPPRLDWRAQYASELGEHVRLAWDLADEQGIGRDICRQT